MNILSIGGTDPSSGAGIQSDVIALSALHVHPLTIVTAITSQNTCNFDSSQAVSTRMLKSQISSVMEDFKIDGIKIGMLLNSQLIKIIHQKFKNTNIPIVVDPVIKSTVGGALIEKTAINDFIKYVIPLATIITPNQYEAQILTRTKNSIPDMAKKIQKLGAKNVIITGIPDKNKIKDFVLDGKKSFFISGNKINLKNHGSGCNYSVALLYSLSSGKNIKDAAKFAKEFTHDSINNAKNIGKGIPITTPQDKKMQQLYNAIIQFTKIKDIYKNIPECQTNFVYSKKNPKTINDIIGVDGRIVKNSHSASLAGNLKYGGSKHVATALIAISKRYPHIQSAINLRYNNDIISNIKKSKLSISKYDRHKEPANIKKHDSTIKWGVMQAIKYSTIPPDVIYHLGDFRKEPMILIFGRNPDDVYRKILQIIGNNCKNNLEHK